MGSEELEKELKQKIGDYSLTETNKVEGEKYKSKEFKTAAERVRKILESERSKVTSS